MLPLVSHAQGQFVQPVSIPIFIFIICAKFIPNQSSHLTTFPSLLNCWHPKPPPQMSLWVSWGELFLAYVHSQMNPQMCTKFGANPSSRLAAFPDLNLWPYTTRRNALWGIEGRIVFSLCPFPDESADVYQIWCRSVQPFDSFPRLWNLCNPPKCHLGYCGVNCI